MKGPFGFIPTTEGLSSSLRLGSSRSIADLSFLLESVYDTFDKVRLEAYSACVEKSHATLVKFEDHLPVWEEIRGSVTLFHIVHQLFVDEFMDIVFEHPALDPDSLREDWDTEEMVLVGDSYIPQKFLGMESSSE